MAYGVEVDAEELIRETEDALNRGDGHSVTLQRGVKVQTFRDDEDEDA